MVDEEYAAFLRDIEERGILSPLEVTAAGVVLDGRHRLRAALELGHDTVPVRRVSPADEVEFMFGAALHRRHLRQSQKAALVLEREEYRQKQARALARRRAGRKLVATLPQGQGRTREFAARQAGVSARLIQDAALVKAEDAHLFAAVKAGEIPAQRAAKLLRRERKLAALPSPPPLPAGPFDVLYVDPPWRSSSPRSEWSPEQHYATLTLEEIKALEPPAADDAVLFLWAVNGLLPEALGVIEQWGFVYKTNLVWIKPSIGLGHWLRNRHELLLLAVRGSIALPDEPDRADSVVEAPRRRHSEKPDHVYELIELMFPGASRVELFARKTRPGWVAWGNEVAA
jgi:N6-adenosine-specific RNA methylase IME4